MPDTLEPTPLCEMRFDVPFAAGRADQARLFERAWRTELTAQKKTALAMPPARAVAARFRVVGPDAPGLRRFLQARLAALPGSPTVTADADAPQPQCPDWAGVQIWLAYPAADLPALLRAPKNAKTNARSNAKPNANRPTHFRGHRP